MDRDTLISTLTDLFDVRTKLDTLKTVSLGDAVAWGVVGLVLVAGLWQAGQPIDRYPEERRAA